MLGVNSGFWNKKKVLLTGHTGFKGSWMSQWLLSMGADLHGLALQPPTQPNLFSLLKLENKMHSHIGDIRSYENTLKIVREVQPEIVIHMAAQPLVRYSYQNPIETYATNVLGTAHVLEAVRQTGTARAILSVTTDKCYENKEWLWAYRENEPLGGYDPYSSSKACAELVTGAYRSSYFPVEKLKDHQVAVASARAGNVIGGGDWAQDRLVPDIIMSFAQGKKVEIRSPNAIRPWQHVIEPVAGYLMLTERLFVGEASFAEAFNFGPNESECQPVKNVLNLIVKHWQDPVDFEISKGTHPHEAGLLKLDSSKAHVKLGWAPRWDLNMTLRETVDWYKAYLQNPDGIEHVTLEQIKKYNFGVL